MTKQERIDNALRVLLARARLLPARPLLDLYVRLYRSMLRHDRATIEDVKIMVMLLRRYR